MNKTNHPMSRNSYPSATANKAIHCFKWGGGTNPTDKVRNDAPEDRFGKLFLFRNAYNCDKSPNRMYVLSGVVQITLLFHAQISRETRRCSDEGLHNSIWFQWHKRSREKTTRKLFFCRSVYYLLQLQRQLKRRTRLNSQTSQ